MALKIGDIAPDFTLYNTEKQTVTLSSFKGKNVVILFFPLAFTSTCTAELCDVRDNLNIYSQLNAEILAISVDSVFSLKAYKAQQNLNFELLSDFNKTVSETYDTLYESFILEMKGVSKRSAFVIDKEGVLQYIEVLEKASEIPDLLAIQTLLKTL